MKHLVGKHQLALKMNIPEIRMLRWMRWGYEMDKIRNKSIIEKLDKHMQDKV